jgi:ATP-dependent helicase Lhr and Lhr-like helicase
VTDRSARLVLKKRLGRTWTAFFERYGNFTLIQLEAIPILLAGENAMICAPTASGKTESVIVPLVERHCSSDISDLTILYLTPTRALVNDLSARLTFPLQSLNISLAVKTHDLTTFDPKQPASILITTPESFDSLLTSYARIFTNLRAVVIDEIHLFDGTARGDQLRVLLSRLREIRNYAASHGEASDADVQYVALSATVSSPEQMAQRYFTNAQIVIAGEQRTLDIEHLPLSEDSADELLNYLESLRSRGWKKALIFCNSRLEVESYAMSVRHRSPFGNAIYVHYSNIAPQRRQEVEARFSSDDVALCFATNTLELGIDVGNIDVVILLGPPGQINAFTQRIGRGNRRKHNQQVACFYRSPLERLIFQAFDTLKLDSTLHSLMPFRLSVAIQQIFSLIKQSPSGSVRLTQLSQLFKGLATKSDIEIILGHLQRFDYVKTERAGDWRPSKQLNDLYDQQARTYVELSIYGNIQGSRMPPVEIRDQHTHEMVATVDAQWFTHSVLSLEGRALNVEWMDGEAIWVSTYQGENIAEGIRYRGTRKQLSFELAQLLPIQLGLEQHQVPQIAISGGWLMFHWLGDLYGHVLLQLLNYHVSVKQTQSCGLYLHLLDEPQRTKLPTWTTGQVQRYLEDNYRRIEPFLELGAFHHLLPISLRRRTVVEQFNVERFIDVITVLEISSVSDTLAANLTDLVS